MQVSPVMSIVMRLILARRSKREELMKWYWAILLAIVILTGLTALLQIGGAKAEWFRHFVIALFAVWVAPKSASLGWGLSEHHTA